MGKAEPVVMGASSTYMASPPHKCIHIHVYVHCMHMYTHTYTVCTCIHTHPIATVYSCFEICTSMYNQASKQVTLYLLCWIEMMP